MPLRFLFNFHINHPSVIVTIPMIKEARPKTMLTVPSADISPESRAGIAGDLLDWFEAARI